jgi:hypothetical protein
VAWTGSIETHDGIEVVSNPSVPFLDSSESGVTHLWTVQDPSWENPSRIHVGSGVVLVGDPQGSRVHRLSTAGEIQASFGQRGEGPGEFLRLQDALPDGDRIAVLDGGKSSIELLDFDGNYLSSIHVGRVIFGGFRIGGGEFLVSGMLGSTTSRLRIAEGRDPITFDPSELEPLPEELGVQCSSFFPWPGGAARLRFTTPRIEVFDEDAHLVREIRIDQPIESVSEEERSLALSEVRAMLASSGLPEHVQQQQVAAMEGRYQIKCRFRSLVFDPGSGYSAFLEQNPDEFGSGNATLHFISEDGVYLATFKFQTAWRDFALADRKIFALARDPVTDVISLEAYRVEFSATGIARVKEVVTSARQSGSLAGR